MARNISVPKLATGLVLGTVAGVAAGMLVAPKTGKENRHLIKERLGTLQGRLGTIQGRLRKLRSARAARKESHLVDITG